MGVSEYQDYQDIRNQEYQDYQFQDYIRYGLELAEYHLLESYDGVKDKTDETDRVFLESVQVFFFAFLL